MLLFLLQLKMFVMHPNSAFRPRVAKTAGAFVDKIEKNKRKDLRK